MCADSRPRARGARLARLGGVNARAWATALGLLAAAVACGPPPAAPSSTDADDLTGLEHPAPLGPDESVLMLFGTNDVHGSFDRLPQLGGYIGAARAHLRSSYGDRARLVVLDAGDATQGTLVSNYSEGMLAVRAMNALGYDAAVAGNHGFDFGPVDWQKDQCDASAASCDPLEALRRSVTSAKFPFLGANVTRRATHDNLDFLPPYVLVPFEGRNVAVLGLENHYTDRTTVPENVAALAFGEGKDELAKNVEALFTSGRADVFVLVMHEGDGDAASMHDFLAGLPRRSDGQPLVDAAIAGHSHRVNDAVVGDIPYIQSGANGEMFGVVELVTKKDAATGRLSVERARTRKRAAIPIAQAPTSFLLEPVTPSADVADIVNAGKKEVAPIAEARLATATAPLSRDGGRTTDSVVGNLLADAMRAATGADVALINGGDVRDDLPAGDVLYEHLFAVLPKNLALVTVDAMPTERLVANVRLAVTSCGRRGALQISGMTIGFRRDCSGATDGEDPNAQLLSLIDSAGQAIYRLEDGRDVFVRPTVRVATTDFVMSGGAGYDRFVGLAPSGAPLVLRDAIAARFRALGTLDPAAFARGRYVDCSALASRPECR